MIAKLGYLWQTIIGPQILWWLLWFGLAALTIALLLLMRTRWGQSKPLGKCLALSLLAHLLLAGYSTTVHLVQGTMQAAGQQTIRITRVDGLSEPRPAEALLPREASSKSEAKPWNLFESSAEPVTDEPEVEPAEVAELTPESDAPEPEPLADDAPIAESTPDEAPIEPAAAEPLVADLPANKSDAPSDLPTEIETAPAERQEAPPVETSAESAPTPERKSDNFSDLVAGPRPPDVPFTPSPLVTPNLLSPVDGVLAEDALERLVDIAPRANPADDTPEADIAPEILPDELMPAPTSDAGPLPGPSGAPVTLDPKLDPAPPAHVPESYEQRLSGRGELASKNGGSDETEQTVDAALAWLARHQSSDGHWDATRFGAGREMKVGGEDRGGAGQGADTGVTGLALLAMLGAGHTQIQGEHSECVRKGLEYLLSQQADDGNLAGRAGLFARMYSHAMATIALGEAYGLTGDERLREPLRKAINYSINAQNPSTGGWRYEPYRVRPAERGDTSQLGWQLMALRSAEIGGLPVPHRAKEGMSRFLRSVAFGNYGGLACYREGEQASRAMTAEALACRMFLGLPVDDEQGNEATAYLMQELPNPARSNMYYWYYATMALYQLQGESWQRWNAALKQALVSTQIADGEHAGSWETTDVWGGHGGRVYTTAMGALCLEVYYRYLPLYGRAIARQPQPATPR